MHLTLLLACFGLGTAVSLRDYRSQLGQLLQRVLWQAQVERCQAIITDELHYDLYDREYFAAVGRQPRANFMLRVNASEDLQSPSEQFRIVLRAIKSSGCDLHVITLLNGLQVRQLIKFVYNTRALHMQQKFVLLHDARLFTPDMLHVWSVYVRSVFLRHEKEGR